jgi:hypothetical protein
MRPEELANQEKLFTAVGRLVVTFSNVENALCVIYVELTEGDLNARVKKFQYNTFFAEKLELIDEAVKAKCGAKQQAIWRRLYDGLHKYRQMRNDVAHKQIMPDFLPEKGHLEFFLRGPTFTPHHPKDHLTAETIHDASVAVEAIYDKLWKFRERISG